MAATEAIASAGSTETWWLYVLECRGGVLYTGMATKSEALRAEYAFKQKSRADKLRWCGRGLESFLASQSEG